jgi:CHAT domain-containing protein
MIYPLFLLLLLSCNLVHAQAQTTILQSAEQAFSQGQFQQAIQLWENALVQPLPESDSLNTQIKLALAYQKLGFYRQAFDRLHQALNFAKASKDKASQALILGQLGDLYLAGYDQRKNLQNKANQVKPEIHYLKQALKMAHQANNPQVLAEILNKQGNLFLRQGHFQKAFDSYQQSQQLAQKTGDQLLATKVLVNQVELAFWQAGTADFVINQIKKALQIIQPLPASHTKSFGLLTLNRLAIQTQQEFNQELKLEPQQVQKIQQIRYQVLQLAKTSAETNQDKLSLSYTYGHLGRLYEDEKRYAQALLLTRKALFLAQEMMLPELIYQWYWQWGRLLKAQGKQESAIKIYQLAINAMQPHNIQDCGTSIQTRLINIGYHKEEKVKFRKVIIPVYLELADLLIQQGELDNAIDAFEKLNFIELKNYLRDDCLTEPEEFIDPKVALLHFILLPDRTELLVKISQEVKLFTILTSGEKIHEIALEFKFSITNNRFFSKYKELATQFYQLFIKPITGFLEQHQITTLVIVPDRALRNIPFAALHDGEHYLIERYAIATSLLGSKISAADPPSGDDKLQVFLGGVSEPVHLKDENKYSRELPNVPDELKGIQKLYPTQSKMFLDVEFIRPVLTTEIIETAYSIIHFASHSSFASDSNKSYLLIYNGKFFLEELKELLLQRRFKEKPIELMTLSACETAQGDDDTILGLGGVAVKAGVKTTLANLWLVNDEAAAKLNIAFYKHFKTPGINKAQALQKAQLELLKQPKFQKPSLWAPLILIGNWL